MFQRDLKCILKVVKVLISVSRVTEETSRVKSSAQEVVLKFSQKRDPATQDVSTVLYCIVCTVRWSSKIQ